MNELTKVNFHGQELIASKDENGNVMVAVKPICEALGLDWSAQLQKIKRDSVLNSTMVMITTVAEDGKNREMITLPLNYLNGFLFSIDDSRVSEEVRPLVIKYKKECYTVLYNYFHKGVAVNEQFPNIENVLELSLKTIREQRVQIDVKNTIIDQQNNEISELKPAQEFIDSTFIPSTRCMYLREYAKIHAFVYPDGSKVGLSGDKSIFKLLKGEVEDFKEIRYLLWNNLPLADYDSNNGNGYFEVKLYNADFAPTPRITPRGQVAVFKKLAKFGIHPHQSIQKQA